MRWVLSACLLLLVAAARDGDGCKDVKPDERAPCGQLLDDDATCTAKGCCFDNATKGAYPCFYRWVGSVPIKRVHIIQANHFDAGFANFTVNILNEYFDVFFPRAYALGLALAARRGPEALRWMTQSYVVWLYLNCPPGAGLHCPTPPAVANFSAAVARGFITWHAFPHNAELELMHPWLIAAGVSVTHTLDARFGQPPKRTLSQRDVPGLTRAALPLLAAAGVAALSVGVNTASCPPSVPRAFVWRDAATGVALPALWHPRGYGGLHAEDAVVLPGLPDALVFAWRGDNRGPPDSVEEVLGDFKAARALFPGADAAASTFDNFTALLTPTVLNALPTIDREIGDTWLYGAPSDPQKLAMARLAGAAAAACVARGDCNASEPRFANFTAQLLKNGEHTWGLDTAVWLADWGNWTNDQLAAQLAARNPRFMDMAASWAEQRAFGLEWPLEALGDHPLAGDLRAAWAGVRPPAAPPDPPGQGFAPLAPNATWRGARFALTFDAATGSLVSVADGSTGQAWGGPLGGLLYAAYTAADYATFLQDYYAGPPPEPAFYPLNFGKQGVGAANSSHLLLSPALRGLWVREDGAGGARFLVASDFGAEPAGRYGAAAAYWTAIDVPGAGAAINLTVSLYNKTATRLPEAHFLAFNASAAWGAGAAPCRGQWFVDKLGARVDPFGVQLRGGQHHHGVLAGLAYTRADPAGAAPNATLAVGSAHAGVAVFGVPTALPFPTLQPPAPAAGAALLLTTNTYGSNYPQWIPWAAGDENMQWAFTLTFS